MTLKEINEQIAEIENKKMTATNISILAKLYVVRDHFGQQQHTKIEQTAINNVSKPSMN